MSLYYLARFIFAPNAGFASSREVRRSPLDCPEGTHLPAYKNRLRRGLTGAEGNHLIRTLTIYPGSAS